jgi:hypothetical protein
MYRFASLFSAISSRLVKNVLPQDLPIEAFFITDSNIDSFESV